LRARASSPAVTSACTVLLCVLAVISTSCARPANLETIGEAMESSGRQLSSSTGVEGEVEALYEPGGPWTLLLVPATGPDPGALRSAGLPDPVVALVTEAAAAWRRGQYLVQVHDGSLLSRMIAEDAVRIREQFVISGQGAVRVVAALKKRDANSVPDVVSLSSSPR
jgi:hypothetical protein